jgi:hypothetical protein
MLLFTYKRQLNSSKKIEMNKKVNLKTKAFEYIYYIKEEKKGF